ncbi:unnamed protein product [Phytophthora lilii]|uniref:Unnamed protein product n=1 Tax=Phytophthora lilii TaxID=2077276 RepID=A0A9W6TYB7_9STRA|nr:unnamed protein product [Phytophthora lilii]
MADRNSTASFTCAMTASRHEWTIPKVSRSFSMLFRVPLLIYFNIQGGEPEWNEAFVFEVEDPQRDELVVKVKDDDDVIGKCRLPVNMFLNGYLADQWYTITDDSEYVGEVHLRVQYRGPNMQPAVVYAAPQQQPYYQQPPPQYAQQPQYPPQQPQYPPQQPQYPPQQPQYPPQQPQYPPQPAYGYGAQPPTTTVYAAGPPVVVREERRCDSDYDNNNGSNTKNMMLAAGAGVVGGMLLENMLDRGSDSD